MSGMQLKAYLDDEGVTYDDFARRIGVANASVVHRYAVKGRIPRSRTIMAAIIRETGGMVQPSDFFACAAE